MLIGGGATCPGCNQTDSTLLLSLLVHQIDGVLTPDEYERLISDREMKRVREWPSPKSNSWKELGKQLSLPDQPRPSSLVRLTSGQLRFVWFFLGLGLLGLLLQILPEDVPLPIWGCVLFGPFLLPISLVVFIAQRSEKQLEKKILIWGNAKSQWSKLWYCARDNAVFIAGQRRLTPPEQMKTFLYEQ